MIPVPRDQQSHKKCQVEALKKIIAKTFVSLNFFKPFSGPQIMTIAGKLDRFQLQHLFLSCSRVLHH